MFQLIDTVLTHLQDLRELHFTEVIPEEIKVEAIEGTQKLKSAVEQLQPLMTVGLTGTTARQRVVSRNISVLYHDDSTPVLNCKYPCIEASMQLSDGHWDKTE